VPLAVPFAKEGGYKALQDGAMVSQSMDPAVAGTCFSEESVGSGFVDAAGYRIVGTAPGSAACLQKIKDLVMMKASSTKLSFLGYPDSVTSATRTHSQHSHTQAHMRARAHTHKRTQNTHNTHSRAHRACVRVCARAGVAIL
jgi:hypothetical protein